MKENTYFARLRERLGEEFRLLRVAVTAADRGTRVPSCPDWDVDQLAHHVAGAYLHKVECIRQGKFPEDWPPETLDPDPVAVLDEAFAALTEAFDEHRPGDPAATFLEADQTVGFWIRRMCHETVVHRLDAELAAGLEFAPVPADIALDGVDEFLGLFMGAATRQWTASYTEVLDGADPRPLAIAAAGEAWTLTTSGSGVEVSRGSAPTDNPMLENPAAVVSGEPTEVLLWLWGRAADRAVRREGDAVLIDQLQALRDIGTKR